MPLASLLEQSAFDADTTTMLATAFDQAWSKVQASGLLVLDETATRTILAERIIDRATQGERDVARLIEDAIGHLANSS